jgi:hypothetical protein
MVGRGFLSRFSGKFLQEVVPVVLASVIGTLLVNQYARRAPAPAVVVQPPPPADDVFQALRDEHQLIVDYLKRDIEAKPAAPQPATPAKPRPAKAAAEKLAPRSPARPVPAKAIEPGDDPPLAPDFASVPAPAPILAALPAPSYQILAADVLAGSSGMVDAVRGWAFAAADMPRRAFADRFVGDPPRPPSDIPWPAPPRPH